MTTAEAVSLLRAEVDKHGSIKGAAWKWGMSDQHLSAMLCGRRNPGPKVLKLLGLRRVIGYEKL